MSREPRTVAEERVVPPPTDPMAVARQFVADRYLGVGGMLLAASPSRLLPPLR